MLILYYLKGALPPLASKLDPKKNKGGRKHCPRINGRFVYNIRATETRGKKSLLARRKFPRKTRSDHKKFAADSLSSSRRRVWGVSVPAVGGFAVHADSGAARCPLRAAVLFSTLEGGAGAPLRAENGARAEKKSVSLSLRTSGRNRFPRIMRARMRGLQISRPSASRL